MINSYLLVEPSRSYSEQLQQFIQAFSEEPFIHGSSAITSFDKIADWLTAIESYKNAETCPEQFVPAEQYIYINENKDVLGILNLRKQLNDYLFAYGGHIGYSIHPAYQGQGLATQMLKEALQKAKAFHIDRVLITCSDTNIGSARVIEKNGGILENIVLDPNDGEMTRRYWINL